MNSDPNPPARGRDGVLLSRARWRCREAPRRLQLTRTGSASTHRSPPGPPGTSGEPFPLDRPTPPAQDPLRTRLKDRGNVWRQLAPGTRHDPGPRGNPEPCGFSGRLLECLSPVFRNDRSLAAWRVHRHPGTEPLRHSTSSGSYLAAERIWTLPSLVRRRTMR